MKREPVKVSIYQDEKVSWDVIWKWEWFIKDIWESYHVEEIILPRLDVKNILDCSCGLGFKTILFAEMGYEVEGSDGSAVAVKYASQLAREKGLNIRFFHSRWEELGERCKRKFDCVFSDTFDWIRTRESLIAAARGIYSVLDKGGKFVFGVPISGPECTRKELKNVMEEVWKRQGRFEVLSPYEKNGVRLTMLTVYDRTPEGILENRIHIIEEHGETRVEVALIMDLYKWTWKDYNEVLRKTGFREVYGIKEKGVGFNIAVK